jgi:hypothetical protein
MSKIFLITLRAADDASAVRALRWLLKTAWRRFGLRAVDVREDVAPGEMTIERETFKRRRDTL